LKIHSIIQRWGLLRIFAISSFVSIISISIVSGFIVFSFLQENLLRREMVISSEFIQSVALINNPEEYFKGSNNIKDKLTVEEFFRHVIGIPDVFRATIYDDNYKIIWSSNTEIMGKTFTDNDELKQAYIGKSIFKQGHASERSKLEHDFLPDDIEQFVESYVPVWDKNNSHIIGVVELYKSPQALYDTIKRGRILVIVVSLFGGIVLYWLLYWLVRTAHQLIETQRVRIKKASSRAVELNEQNLRRIGSELHDGPVQSIGFALLKLDSIFEQHLDSSQTAQEQPNIEIANKIQIALSDALQEIRSLSAGLVIPDLKDQPAKEAILKVIERHEKRTSTQVRHQIKRIPDALKTSTKICMYRLVQEGLNNAFNHGKGIDQNIRVAIEDNYLILTISDGGPGMDITDFDKINESEHLGLRGLRERVESLGGNFLVSSSDDGIRGVTLTASLPIDD